MLRKTASFDFAIARFLPEGLSIFHVLGGALLEGLC
jgi:hypothetical protein